MALPYQRSAHVMGAAVRLHRDNVERQLRRKDYHALATQPAPQDDRAILIQPDQAAAVLAQINLKDDNAHGPLLIFHKSHPIEGCVRKGRAIHKGERAEAIGRSRGGRTTKIHALSNRLCRPIAFLLTGGQVADCTAGALLLKRLPATRILHAEKGSDSDAIRRKLEANGTMPNIPPKTSRRWKPCFSPFLYRDRNAIERMFCRLMDFRRVAPRYDR